MYVLLALAASSAACTPSLAYPCGIISPIEPQGVCTFEQTVYVGACEFTSVNIVSTTASSVISTWLFYFGNYMNIVFHKL